MNAPPNATCTGASVDDLTGCTHLKPALQVLTSDQSASGPDLLFALKGRWVIETVFKYLDFYGIDWLVDYHADIQINTKLVDNPGPQVPLVSSRFDSCRISVKCVPVNAAIVRRGSGRSFPSPSQHRLESGR
jgi:hypothetical protein